MRDPERYGVVTFDENDRPVRMKRSQRVPDSNWAITGLYFFDNEVVRYASRSAVGEGGAGNNRFADDAICPAGTLHVERMGRGFAWLDTGTLQKSLIDAASFVQTLETRQGMKVACLEIAFPAARFIDREQVLSSPSHWRKVATATIWSTWCGR